MVSFNCFNTIENGYEFIFTSIDMEPFYYWNQMPFQFPQFPQLPQLPEIAGYSDTNVLFHGIGLPFHFPLTAISSVEKQGDDDVITDYQQWQFVDDTPSQLKAIQMNGVQMLLNAAQLENEEEMEGIKRKRKNGFITIACDECRASHLQCNGYSSWIFDEGKSCSQCERRGLHCNFTPRPLKKQKTKHIN